MRLFWQKGRKIRSTERFKMSAILNARFRVSYFKLKVNGRAVTSQTDKQPIVEVRSVCVCTGQPTWTNFQFDSPGMKLLFSSWALLFHPFQQLGLVISSFSSLVMCVAFRTNLLAVFFVVFTLAFTTGQTSSGSLPFIGCLILFSRFSLVCFIICNSEKGLFVLIQQTSDFMASLGQGLAGLGQLPVLAIHCFFSLLACPFVSRVISFICDVRVSGVVSMFNEPLILSLYGVVRERLLPCRVVVG